MPHTANQRSRNKHRREKYKEKYGKYYEPLAETNELIEGLNKDHKRMAKTIAKQSARRSKERTPSDSASEKKREAAMKEVFALNEKLYRIRHRTPSIMERNPGISKEKANMQAIIEEEEEEEEEAAEEEEEAKPRNPISPSRFREAIEEDNKRKLNITRWRLSGLLSPQLKPGGKKTRKLRIRKTKRNRKR